MCGAHTRARARDCGGYVRTIDFNERCAHLKLVLVEEDLLCCFMWIIDMLGANRVESEGSSEVCGCGSGRNGWMDGWMMDDG